MRERNLCLSKSFHYNFETNDLCVLLLKLPGASCYFYANNNLTPLLLLFLLELLQHDPREKGRGGRGEGGRHEVRKRNKKENAVKGEDRERGGMERRRERRQQTSSRVSGCVCAMDSLKCENI